MDNIYLLLLISILFLQYHHAHYSYCAFSSINFNSLEAVRDIDGGLNFCKNVETYLIDFSLSVI